MIRLAMPSPALRAFVQHYAHMALDVPRKTVYWPIPARTFACLEFTFGVPYEIHDASNGLSAPTFGSALIGAKTQRKISLELNGHVETFVILLQPTGLRDLFGVPEAEMVDTHYDAHGAIGAAMTHLRNQLGEASTFAERVRIAEAFLVGRLAKARPPGLVRFGTQAILANHGGIRIRDLTAQAGVSLRQFERMFTRQVGITPKMYARIARFESAVRLRAHAPAKPWATIAQDLGYYDQMHLVHDFHLLAGESPNSLLRKLDVLAAGL